MQIVPASVTSDQPTPAMLHSQGEGSLPATLHRKMPRGVEFDLFSFLLLPHLLYLLALILNFLLLLL